MAANDDDESHSVQAALREPLLTDDDDETNNHNDTNNNNGNIHDDDNGATDEEAALATTHADSTDHESSSSSFSAWQEISDMCSLGIPLAISFFCRMGMASTDSAFVGHLHTAEHSAETFLAASVLSDVVLNVLITPPLAFNQVLNALVSQAMGSGNPRMAGIWLQQSCLWLSMTMLPCLCGFFFVEPILMALGFPKDISAVAGVYAKYNLLWPIPNGLYQCMRFYFQAQGLPRPAMYNNLLFLFVNAFLNWIFVFGGPTSWKGWGFVGAAISLSISRTMQGVVYFFYMFVYKQHHKRTWPDASVSFWEHHTMARTMEFLKQSVPNIGTLLFQVLASQATTVLVGRLGELSIATSSALSTVTTPWAGSLSATCTTISGVRVGYHMGRGQPHAARAATRYMLIFLTLMNILVAAAIWPGRHVILQIATNAHNVLDLGETILPAVLVGTYLSLMVSNITGGVLGGMGRPLLSTILSLGVELPLSIGGVAIYILVMHGNLLGVYWWQALAAGLELILVIALLMQSDWEKCAREAQERNEARPSDSDDDNNTQDGDHDGETNDHNGGDDENDDTTPQGTMDTEPQTDNASSKAPLIQQVSSSGQLTTTESSISDEEAQGTHL